MSLRQIPRRLFRAPVFTAAALLTLAIGIAATTTMFTVVNGVLLKPLSYPDSGALVALSHKAPGLANVTNLSASPTMYFTYREESRAFAALGVYTDTGGSVTGLGDPERVTMISATYGTLDALGVPPALGRVFSQSDDTPGSPETVVLTYGYWQRKFGGDPAIVGRGITIESRPREIIGVMPRTFRFLDEDTDLFVPLRFNRNQIFLGNFSYRGIARLRSGATLAQANADVARMLPLWLAAWVPPPGYDRRLFEDAHLSPALHSLKDEVVGDAGNMLWVLMGTIGLVLLIACANVANLLLVRAEGRQMEFAVRSALGAGWRDIAGDLMLESVALGLVGGALGVGIAAGALRVLLAYAPANVPRITDIAIDPTVLAFAFATSIVSGVLFGIIPALRYARPGLPVADSLRGGGRTASHSRIRLRARNTLVVVQIALAMVLLVAAGLMMRTAQALRAVQPGFRSPEQVQLLRVSIPAAHVARAEDVVQMEQAIRDRIATVPGVSAAAFVSAAPLDGNDSADLMVARDKTYASGSVPPIRAFRYVSPGSFETFGTPLVAGRDFTWSDIYDRRPVAIVSEKLARELWGQPSAAIDKQVAEVATGTWRSVVGVVANVRTRGLDQDAPTTVYWPALMSNFYGNPDQISRTVTFVVRSPRTGAAGFLDDLRRAVWDVDRMLPLSQVRTLQALYEKSLARTSFALLMLTIAAGMALLLGIIGIYGVISYAVSQRRREIGIRIALGAQNGALKRMFVGRGLALAGVGILIGVAAALALTHVMKALLFGVSAVDPVTYAGVSIALAAAAAAASYVPARRAVIVDPVESLRAE